MKTAFLFAGQGAQYIGMGKDLYETFPESKAVFDKADQVLGFSLSRYCFEGPQEKLKATDICQPAVLTMSIAGLEAFKAHGCEAKRSLPEGDAERKGAKRSEASPKGTQSAYVAGLSLGEYSALVAAGAISFEDALQLVRKRAELMNEACLRHPGTMAAVIGLERDMVMQICFVSGKAEIANLNAPGQIVISGEREAVAKAKALALEKGAKTVIDLEVSGAFHSSLMKEAAAEFKPFLDKVTIVGPEIPVVSNYDAKPAFDAGTIRQNLVRQIYSSVLWEDSVRFMLSGGVTKFYEFGPGKVLKGLMRRIDQAAVVVTVEKKEDILNYDVS